MSSRKPEKPKIAHEVEEIKEQFRGSTKKSPAEAIELIANSDVGNNKTLMCNGEPLTVGRIKSFFGHKLLENGCLPEEDIIVACGTKIVRSPLYGRTRRQTQGRSANNT